ncbi:MAG: M48 family metallopeptidase [Pseudomonadota bacterium]
MLKLTPILLAALVGYAMFRFSAWRMGRELTARSTVLAEPRLLALTERMAEVLEIPKITVHVYEQPVVNGLAAPDGRIFLTRGFLDKYRLGEVTAEELASVVAHELGHVALGHSQRRMIDFSAQNAIRLALGMILGRLIPFVGVWLADMLASLLAARLSRQAEFEADEYAAALLTKAGIGTAPQRRLLEKLDTMMGGGPRFAWLMSHPKTTDRVAAIAELEARWGTGGAPLRPRQG